MLTQFRRICRSRNGVGKDYSRHLVTLVSQRNRIADAPSSFEDIAIYRFNTDSGSVVTYTPQQLGMWVA